MNNFSNIIGSAINILNNNLTDYYNGTRVGSYFFDDDHEIVFLKYMPKGQVSIDTSTYSDKSFGTVPTYSESFRFYVHYFTKHGELGSGTSMKNRELACYALDEAKILLLTHCGSFGCVDLSFDTVDRPMFLQEQNVYIASLPVIVKVRK